MKQLRLILFAILLSSAGNYLLAQCNEWETLTGYKNVSIRDIARDRFGNVYAVGSFSSQSFQIGSTQIPLQGKMSMFILKFNKAMNLQWAKSIGSSESEFPMAIEIDKEDNIVIGGYFYSPSITFDCIQLNNSGQSEMFVVKYSAGGHALWALGSTGLRDGFIMNLSIDHSNDIIISSTFAQGNATFGGKSFTGFGGYDAFVASISEKGSLNWLSEFGSKDSEGYDYIYGLDVDSEDNIAITGFFGSSSISFDNITVDGPASSENYFVTKLDKSGKVLWAKGSEYPADQSGLDVVVDHHDNIIVGGRYYGEKALFDEVTLHNTSESNTSDVFVAKYDSEGRILSARSFGGSEFDSPNKITIDADGNPVIAGYYYSYTFIVDAFKATKSDYASDAFIVTLDEDLQATCLKKITGTAENSIDGLKIDDSNNVWAIVLNALGEGTTEFDDAFAINSNQFTSMAVSAGSNSWFDQARPATEHFDVHLGNDMVKCKDETVTFDAGIWCSEEYSWSDGSHERFMSTKSAGTYWVEVTADGRIARDTIVVVNLPDFIVDLGEDRSICPGTTVELDVTQSREASYIWSDGDSLTLKSITTPGTYSVIVNDQCGSFSDSMTVTWISPLSVDLGNNRVVCDGKPIMLSAKLEGDFQYEWQDGSHASDISADHDGIYMLTVTGQCESVSDSVQVLFFDADALEIPNVITPNGDERNESLILPDVLDGSTIRIFDRYGTDVFKSPAYHNTWDAAGLDSGVYFFTLDGPCESYKGVVQVMR